MRNTWWGRILRIFGIVLMGLTAAFTLMGGAGTACSAFNPQNPQWSASMSPLAQMQGLYIFYVIATVGIGLNGIWSVVLLIRGKANAYKYAVWTLVAGMLVGGLHIYTSRILRGASMPVDMVVFTTGFTLLVFLLFRFPPVWRGANFDWNADDPDTGANAAAITVISCGLLTLAAPLWGAASHTMTAGGVNWAGAWPLVMNGLGLGLVLSGAGLSVGRNRSGKQQLEEVVRTVVS
ncbi:MAG: hypothetical protein JXA13_08695 [Anaerolineales bacterium]|nr:hypothetical protein [Anaerolineales bacterium]